MKKLIHQAAFEDLSGGIAETFKKNKWSEEDFFESVETHRDEKRKSDKHYNILKDTKFPKVRIIRAETFIEKFV